MSRLRTVVQILPQLAVDAVGLSETMDTKGFHQLFIYGKLEHEIRAYGKLAGIEELSIA